MPFPTPPPLKEKPLAPSLPPYQRPANPNGVWLIIGFSVLFWIVFLGLIALLLVLLFRPWIQQLKEPGILYGVLIALILWSGISLGWRIGSAIVIVAMRKKLNT